jgi:hypothetical protein
VNGEEWTESDTRTRKVGDMHNYQPPDCKYDLPCVSTTVATIL